MSAGHSCQLAHVTDIAPTILDMRLATEELAEIRRESGRDSAAIDTELPSVTTEPIMVPFSVTERCGSES